MKFVTFLVFLIFSYSSATDVTRWFSVIAPSGYGTQSTTLSWSPDNRFVALNFDKPEGSEAGVRWHIYEVETGRLLHEMTRFIGWYPDSSRFIMQSERDTPVQVVDTRTGAVLAVLKNAGGQFSQRGVEGEIISLDDDHTLRIYDAETGAMRFNLKGVWSIPYYSPDKKLFVVYTYRVGLQVYDAVTFTLLYALEGYSVRSGENWSPDSAGLIVTPINSRYHKFGPYFIWTLNSGLSAPIYNVTSSMVWSPDGRLVAVSSDHTKVRIYEAGSGELVETIRGNYPLRVSQWYRDYLLVYTGMIMFDIPNTLAVRDMERNAWVFETGLGLDFIYRVRIEGDQVEIFQPFIGMQQIDLKTGNILHQVEFSPSFWTPSPDYRWLVNGGFPEDEANIVPIEVYRSDSFELIDRVKVNASIVSYIVWSPDSRYFVSIGDLNIVFWRMPE
jgi:WD40 repeat protein